MGLEYPEEVVERCLWYLDKGVDADYACDFAFAENEMGKPLFLPCSQSGPLEGQVEDLNLTVYGIDMDRFTTYYRHLSLALAGTPDFVLPLLLFECFMICVTARVYLKGQLNNLQLSSMSYGRTFLSAGIAFCMGLSYLKVWDDCYASP